MFELTEQEFKQIVDYVDKADEECDDICHETESCNDCDMQKFIDLIKKFEQDHCSMIFVIVKLWRNQVKNFDIIEQLIKENNQLKIEKERLELKVEISELKRENALIRLKLQQAEIDKSVKQKRTKNENTRTL